METEAELAGLCLALLEGCAFSGQERRFAKEAVAPDEADLTVVRQAILQGEDPLGEAFASIRSAAKRRTTGAVYTPLPIVRSMVAWVATQGMPVRVVDPGAGSGRFIMAAADVFPDAELVAIEVDPLAALMLRANLSVRGLLQRCAVVVKDYRSVKLPRRNGITAFVGNPPYVRHHGIEEGWKAWYASCFATLGIKASALAGLHLHFFLQTSLLGKPGDLGAFITSAEWLDVNYGSALRRLFLEQLGGRALHVLSPTVQAFPDTATTAAITCFRVGREAGPVSARFVEELDQLDGLAEGTQVPRACLETAPRWSIVVRPSTTRPAGEVVELGELFRVHRGQVTGANAVWIAGEHSRRLPARVLFPAVTKARDLIEAGSDLRAASSLRRVIDLPADLDGLTTEELRRVRAFLKWAKEQGADQGYIARHRKAWWSVGLKPAAPILCTYMARRPPQFCLNACDARHINVAHGLYPREPIGPGMLARLVAWLNGNVGTERGRTYAGGLTKFEPREIERLLIPPLEALKA